jgi:hypothetical protein
MFEASLILDRLENSLEALERSPVRLETIETAVVFQQSEDGRVRRDASWVSLSAVYDW